MTKKQFKKDIQYHYYRGNCDENSIRAVFFDYAEYTDTNAEKDELLGYPFIRGFKYCVYCRASLATKDVLINSLYDFINNVISDTPYFIQLVVASIDSMRFRVPLSSSGLTKLINPKEYFTYEKLKN